VPSTATETVVVLNLDIDKYSRELGWQGWQYYAKRSSSYLHSQRHRRQIRLARQDESSKRALPFSALNHHVACNIWQRLQLTNGGGGASSNDTDPSLTVAASTSTYTMASELEITIGPAHSLWGQPWAESLHSTIIRSFKRKDIQAFPPSWTRLNPDPASGISGLSQELGDHGHIAVLLVDGEVVGCGGFLPFRGNDWINREKSAEDLPHDSDASITESEQPHPSPQEWEICCFCVHPDYRKQGLSKTLLKAIEAAIRQRGGHQLAANYSSIETGDFWSRAGFKPIPGATSTLKKGFTHTPGMEGLRENIHFQVAVKQL
jgi:GNAT superfamily N-acetyltransferase